MSKQLLIMRHAEYEEIGPEEEHEKWPLSLDGRLQGLQVLNEIPAADQIDAIIHSPILRAAQTGSIMRAGIKGILNPFNSAVEDKPTGRNCELLEVPWLAEGQERSVNYVGTFAKFSSSLKWNKILIITHQPVMETIANQFRDNNVRNNLLEASIDYAGGASLELHTDNWRSLTIHGVKSSTQFHAQKKVWEPWRDNPDVQAALEQALG